MKKIYDYRIVTRPYINEQGEEAFTYGIYEAFYDEFGNLERLGNDPIVIERDTLDDLNFELDMCDKAYRQPIIDYWNSEYAFLFEVEDD